MKALLLSALGLLLAGSASAQPPAGDARPGDAYGAPVGASPVLPMAEVAARLESDSAYVGVVRAKIVDVCPKKGCWLTLAVNDSTTAFVKMKDYGFFLPTAAIGKTVLLEGQVQLITTSVSELQHYAKDAKKSAAEIAAITAPKREIRVMASGIKIVE